MEAIIQRVRPYLSIFIVTIMLFSFLYFKFGAHHIPDFDSYYHVKMAKIMLEKGFIKEFPWMYFTFQKDHFTNPYLLFHMYLAFWVLLFKSIPMVGAKWGMLVLTALIPVACLRIVNLFSTKWNFFFALLFFACLTPMVYSRFIVARPHVLSTLLLLVGVELLARRKWWMLFALAWIYSYSYSACFLLPILAGISAIVFSINQKKIVWEPIFFSVTGMIMGLSINPAFPHNLNFLYIVTFKMGIGHSAYAGRELLSLPAWPLFMSHIFTLSIIFAGLLTVMMTTRKCSENSVFIFAVSGFFLMLMAHSVRFSEYWPFMAMISVAVLFIEFFDNNKTAVSFFRRYLSIICMCVFVIVGFFNVSSSYKNIITIIPMAELNEIMNVLNRDAKEGDIVYTEDWEMFSPMFYECDKVNYMLGLDPETMKVAHPGLFTLWFMINRGRVIDENIPQNISMIEKYTHDPEITKIRMDMENGLFALNVPSLIKRAFNAKWILITHGHYGEEYDMKSFFARYPQEIIQSAGNRFFTLYKVK
ncbi:conserved hypothetical protein, membrane [Candidatus Omnitrophus magneticus]|uniref:Glycosyltransferase RgtA/B/C/D-like domain-containing protein n=1 Tax=Candidatus Omnitrophus magneticus TaxID=1609969 RepID=A0A0F0CKP3_9BACT|nr:conserved hypothetical protein, membrane [Candidatus Omnitrophus magneticus]